MSNNNTAGTVGQAGAQAGAQAILDMLKNTNSTAQWPSIGQVGPLTIGQVHAAAATGAAPAYAPNNSNYSFTTAGTVTGASYNQGLDLRGDADIKIDGMSLKDFMKRLNLMVPNPEIEKQWDELRTLGEAYRAVEKECLEKAKVWDILKRDNI
jgi:hypothetical protein